MASVKPRVVRMAGFEDRLTVIDHLEELRGRLLVCLGALAVAFALCLWQSGELLHIVNGPLTRQTQSQVRKGGGPLGQTALTQQALLAVAAQTEKLASELSSPSAGLPAGTRAALASTIPRLRADVAKVPRTPTGDKPVTLGVGEPFATTVTVALYFAVLLSLPLILFELYGFILPALDGRERRAVAPLLWMVPVLFVSGVLFGYFVVLPATVQFLLNFNSGEFNVLVQANQYYEFAATILLAMGLAFELPVAILGAVRAGALSTRTLRKGRRWALLGCVVIAAVLPGELLTMALEAVPLYILYEASILIAMLAERSAARAHASASQELGAGAA
jgi:sec-independent protein translocase protein TatC